MPFLQTGKNRSFIPSMPVPWDDYTPDTDVVVLVIGFACFLNLFTHKNWKTRINNFNISNCQQAESYLWFSWKQGHELIDYSISRILGVWHHQCFSEEKKIVHCILYWKIVVSLWHFNLAPHWRYKMIYWQRSNYFFVIWWKCVSFVIVSTDLLSL